MRLLLTGARGYVGGWLLEDLLRDGHPVHCLGRRELMRPELAALPGPCVEHRFDGSFASVEAAVGRARPDAVLHLAAHPATGEDPQETEELLRANLLFPAWLLQACVQHGVRRFVNTGTWWQWNAQGVYSPLCLYAASKQCFEDVLELYTQRHGMAAITLVLYDVYGPGDPRPKWFGQLLEAARLGRSLPMTADEQRLCLLHVSDAVRAFRQALRLLVEPEPPCGHRRYFAHTSPRRLADVVARLEQILGRPGTARLGALPYADRTRMEPFLGELLPGWRPRVDLEEGLRSLVDG